jgi:hypothetical protein
MSERSFAVQFLKRTDASLPDRIWCGNDNSARQHHGVVALNESPLVLELSWRASKLAAAKYVCCVQLDLPRLVAAGLVRYENSERIRLRFYHDHDGNVYIQTKLGEPRYLVGCI